MDTVIFITIVVVEGVGICQWGPLLFVFVLCLVAKPSLEWDYGQVKFVWRLEQGH